MPASFAATATRIKSSGANAWSQALVEGGDWLNLPWIPSQPSPRMSAQGASQPPARTSLWQSSFWAARVPPHVALPAGGSQDLQVPSFWLEVQGLRQDLSNKHELLAKNSLILGLNINANNHGSGTSLYQDHPMGHSWTTLPYFRISIGHPYIVASTGSPWLSNASLVGTTRL